MTGCLLDRLVGCITIQDVEVAGLIIGVVDLNSGNCGLQANAKQAVRIWSSAKTRCLTHCTKSVFAISIFFDEAQTPSRVLANADCNDSHCTSLWRVYDNDSTKVQSTASKPLTQTRLLVAPLSIDRVTSCLSDTNCRISCLQECETFTEVYTARQ